MTVDKGINGHLREIARKSRTVQDFIRQGDALLKEIELLEKCLLVNHGEVTANLLEAIEMAKAGVDVIAEEQK